MVGPGGGGSPERSRTLGPPALRVCRTITGVPVGGARPAPACCRSGSSLFPVLQPPSLPLCHALPGSAARSAQAAPARGWAGLRTLPGAKIGGARGPGADSWPLGCAQSRAEPPLPPPVRLPPHNGHSVCPPLPRRAGITVAWAGTLSFLSSPLPPRVCFSSRLSSKRARDTAGKQSGAKQTFLVGMAWIRPNFPFACSATCEFL